MITQIKNKLPRFIKKAGFVVLPFTFCLLSFTFHCQAQAEPKQFIYDAKGKRDPFVSLLDRKSPTGLRMVFKPPKVSSRLPVSIEVQGILSSGGEEYYAIINDKVMKSGQNLGLVKIKDIKKDRVIVEYRAEEFTVFLRKKEKE